MPYSASVTAGGGTGTGYTYTITSGSLPSGLSLTSTGAITGIPTQSGTFSITVTVTDSAGNRGSTSCTLTVVQPYTPPVVSTNCAGVSATLGAAITPVTLAGSGGVGGPYTFSATGLPAGLTLSGSGVLSGAPTVSGTFSYTVTVKDSAGNTGTSNCSVTVSVNLPTCSTALVPITYNVNNENSKSAGEIVWFNSHLTRLSGTIPTSNFTIYVQNGQITFGTLTLQVPNAVLNFSASATVSSTTFDNSTNTWYSTFPLSAAGSADEIFMAGLAYLLPSDFAQNVGKVTWNATVYTTAPSFQVTWQYGVTNWLTANKGTTFPALANSSPSNFLPDYNGMMINPAHNAPVPTGYSGDHAGAPEFSGRGNVLTGGGSGGGGSNWTGSWSSTPAASSFYCSNQPVSAAAAATIGFWHNQNGQALLDSLNGGPSATQLGNWLASTFPNLYGTGAGSAQNLGGMANSQVVSSYLSLFQSDKTGAQIMSAAFACYVTSTTLGGYTAVGYGFHSTGQGTGSAGYNVGTNGSAIGLTNNQSYSVLALLQQVNLSRQNGTYSSAANAFNTIFSGINTTGDITS
jgi:hypothetical protein